MLEHIIKYWITYACGLITAAFTFVISKLRHHRAEQKLLREGILALLHDRLYEACSRFISDGVCSVEDKRNLEYLYKPYEKMGGNGVCRELYERCMKLPLP
ncbi:MAG TPA: hypothetical protein PLZ27_05715 [Bacillota bacterium]|nr:hypothetical protein [Clostridiales bacterium]HPU18147.1 hypothetical protein [Bacillota bacterium]